MTMSKAELIDKLTSDADHERLDGDTRWRLRSKLCVWRFAAFSHFMVDVHEQLAILSKSFQSNKLVVYDIARNLNKTLKALEKLGKAGVVEASFWSEVRKDEGADVMRTCQLLEGSSGRDLLKEDRKQTLSALDDHLIERYRKVLDDPVLLALTSFDHSKWPSSPSLLDGLYDENIETLYNAFKRFYEPTETLENVLEQWNAMTTEIRESTGLMLTKHHDLWARMLVHKHEEYPLALRLVAISLLIPTDTSECERIFSLINDIKTAERSRMGTQVLKNLMIWHRSARKLEEDGSLSSKHMSCYEVPVMQIVQEFRNMAGVKGRKAHRAWPIPSYDYEKGRTNAAKEAAESAKAHHGPKSSGIYGSDGGGSGGGGSGSGGGGAGVAAVVGGPAATDDSPIGGQEVDNLAAGGYFARWGEHREQPRGDESGQHLGTRRILGGDTPS